MNNGTSTTTPSTDHAARSTEAGVRNGALVLGGGQSLVEAKRMLHEFRAFVKSILQQGTDYGVIPGTEKPCLYKAGAERIFQLYNLAPQFQPEVATEDFAQTIPFFFYRIKCVAIHRPTGNVVGEGIGSCNSRETKYRWRTEYWKDKKTAPTPEQLADGWQPFRGQYGPTWRRRIENADTADVANTVLKMAKKRAFIDCALTVGAASEFFSQDIDELDVDEAIVFNAREVPDQAQLERIKELTEALEVADRKNDKKAFDALTVDIQNEPPGVKKALRTPWAKAKKAFTERAEAEQAKKQQDESAGYTQDPEEE